MPKPKTAADAAIRANANFFTNTFLSQTYPQVIGKSKFGPAFRKVPSNYRRDLRGFDTHGAPLLASEFPNYVGAGPFGREGGVGMILITGAAGFIGSTSLQRCGRGARRSGHRRSSRSPFRDPPESVERLDVLDLQPGDLDEIDTIIHLASRKSIPESFTDRSLIHRNIEVDQHVLDLVTAHPIRRLIMASSCEVYGDIGGVLSETRQRRPRSPYAVGKVATELLADLTSSLTTTNICCACFFNTFGPGEGLDAVIPRFVHDAVHRGGIDIEGSGEQRRYFSYIAPVVSILERLCDSEATPAVVNVAAGEERSVLEVARELQRLIGPFDIRHVVCRPNEISGFVPDLTSLQRVVGTTAPTSFVEALRACVDYELADDHHRALSLRSRVSSAG